MSQILQRAELVAPASRRQAFYRIWIEPAPVGFRVAKESGAAGRILYRQVLDFGTIEEAKALFTRRIREKTDPARTRARIYQLHRTSQKGPREHSRVFTQSNFPLGVTPTRDHL